MRLAFRLLPLLLLVLVIAGIFFLDGFSYLELEKVRAVHKELLSFVERCPIYASLLFLSAYGLYAITSVPGLIVLDLLAGYLFGPFMGLGFVLLGATAGAVLVFLATRHAFAAFIEKRKLPLLEKIKEGFHKYPGSYLLFLRIFPLFPFGPVNIALAFLEVNLTKFVWTTLLGLFPISLIYTHLGTGLGAIFDQAGSIQVRALFNAEMIIALVGLGIISLTPILYKKYRRETS